MSSIKKIERKVFPIPDSGKMETPIVELKFWAWLNVNSILCKDSNHYQPTLINAYLHQLGYSKEVHKLAGQDLQILKMAVSHRHKLKGLSDQEYNVVAVRKVTKKRTIMNSRPLSHNEACTMKSKINPNGYNEYAIEKVQ